MSKIEEIVAAGGDVHPTATAILNGTLYTLSFATIHRIALDGTIEMALELDGNTEWSSMCAHEGELWIAGGTVVRWKPGSDPVSVPITPHDDLKNRGSGSPLRAVTGHEGAVWIGGRESQILRRTGEAFELQHKLANVDKDSKAMAKGSFMVVSMLSTSEGLYFGMLSKGLYRIQDGSVTNAGIRSGVTDVVELQSGALLACGPGTKKERGVVWRREKGAKKPTKSTTPGTAWMEAIAQLPDGRIIIAARDHTVFESKDDGKTFTELTLENPSKRDFKIATRIEECVVVGGPFAPMLKIS